VRGEVDTPEDFQSWVTRMKTPAEPDSGSVEAQGKQIFTTHACIACHTLTGTTAAGQVGPNLTRVGARHYVGAGILPMTAFNVALWITHPSALKPGAKMPGIKEGAAGFPPTGLTWQQAQAVAAYLVSLR